MKYIDGLREKKLEWMQNYLKNREMRTAIRETASSWGNVLSGVLQGSEERPKKAKMEPQDRTGGNT